ncbi:MAG: hypothetical protein WCY19_02625 [Candidatus Gastranaerophilaceae bacterium]
MTQKKKELKAKVKKFNDGLSFKLYSHFDRPYSLYYRISLGNKKFKIVEKSQDVIKAKREKILSILNDKEEIIKHSFYPFIAYDIVERHNSKINKMKYDKQYYEKKIEETTGTEEIQKLKIELNNSQTGGIKKPRPIRYSAHFDGFIYSYYAKQLAELYEKKVQKYEIENEVLAYRKTPDDESSHRHDNANMAKEVFDEIRKRKNNCVALAFDIKGFFDCIDHKKLKQEWINVLKESDKFTAEDLDDLNNGNLPKDHYNIYKSLTNYCYVDMQDLCVYFKKYKKEKCSKDCGKCKRPKLPKLMFEEANDFHVFRKWAKAESKDKHVVLKKNKGLFKDEKEINGRNYVDPFGIPQGSPMSALLSNIYMLPFDKEMKELADRINGHYRRYCDDIMFICLPEYKNEVNKTIRDAIKSRGEHLIIHPIIDGYKYSKSQCYDFTDKNIKKQPLQYLGFEFDGEKTKIRKSSLARYYRKSKRAVIATYINARKRLIFLYKNNGLVIQEKHKKLYREDLYRKYTHIGKRNFIYYAKRSFNSIKDEAIQAQIKTHFERINKLIEFYDKKIEKTCMLLEKSKRK